jgi:hypothetical protein
LQTQSGDWLIPSIIWLTFGFNWVIVGSLTANRLFQWAHEIVVASYNRNEAREWARENFTGVIDVIIPSFTNDLKSVNEKAVRHDIRKNMGIVDCHRHFG